MYKRLLEMLQIISVYLYTTRKDKISLFAELEENVVRLRKIKVDLGYGE
jgi:hypothetical protein